jgi:hypothetical protein
MENDPNNANAPVTKADLKAEFGKFEERLDKKLDKLLSEQADVILEAVGETMEKKLDEKFDPVITKLDGILKRRRGAATREQHRCGATPPTPRPTAEARSPHRKARDRTRIILLSPMLVHKCDNCKKEIKKENEGVVAGLGWPNYSFCARCGDR